MGFPNDLGGFVDGDPALAGVVGRFRYKFGFYRLFNGMLGLRFRLLPHDANHSTLWALDERPLRRVVELQLLKGLNYDTSFARSKDWEEFAKAGARQMDFAFTVCNDAANESCPI